MADKQATKDAEARRRTFFDAEGRITPSDVLKPEEGHQRAYARSVLAILGLAQRGLSREAFHGLLSFVAVDIAEMAPGLEVVIRERGSALPAVDAQAKRQTTLTDALVTLDAVISSRTPTNRGDVVLEVPEAVLRAFAAEGWKLRGSDLLPSGEMELHTPGRRFVIREKDPHEFRREYQCHPPAAREPVPYDGFLRDVYAVCSEAAAKSGLPMREALRAMLTPVPVVSGPDDMRPTKHLEPMEGPLLRGAAEPQPIVYRGPPPSPGSDLYDLMKARIREEEARMGVNTIVRGEGPHGGRSDQVGERQQQQRPPTRNETLGEVVDYLRNGLPQGVGGMVTVQQVIGGVERMKACAPGCWAEVAAYTPLEEPILRRHLPGCGLDKDHGGKCGPAPKRCPSCGGEGQFCANPWHRTNRPPTHSEMLDAEWNAALDTAASTLRIGPGAPTVPAEAAAAVLDMLSRLKRKP